MTRTLRGTAVNDLRRCTLTVRCYGRARQNHVLIGSGPTGRGEGGGIFELLSKALAHQQVGSEPS